MIPQKVTIDTTLRIFWFKILNNIFYLSKKISKFDLDVSPPCSLCNQHPLIYPSSILQLSYLANQIFKAMIMSF